MELIVFYAEVFNWLFLQRFKAAPPGAGIFAYYSPGNKDGTRNGTYFLKLSDIKAFKRFELIALSLHESNPGTSLVTL